MKKMKIWQRIQKWFNNLKFKKKLLLSYLLVGIVPFTLICGYLLSYATRNIEQAMEDGFQRTFEAQVGEMQSRAQRIENAIDLVCMDDTVINVATASYTSEYRKYMDISGRFDSAMESLLLMNPEITSYTMYVSNNMAGTRSDFVPLERLADAPVFSALQRDYQSKWYYQDGGLYLAQKVYNANSVHNYAVLVLKISDKKFFADMDQALYQVSFGGEDPVFGIETVENEERYSQKTAGIFGGAGELTLFFDRSEARASARETLVVMVTVLLLSFGVLILLISIFSNWFVRRIQRINQYLSRVVKEEFTLMIPVDYQDEIGEMTGYVNDMIEETRYNIYDVYQSELKKRKYEIKALQAQLNPHFLYNTLSAINWYAIQSGDERISGIVTSLSKFYRTALNNGESVTTIRNELQNIQAYVDIQLRIHDGSFTVEYEIDEAVMDYRIPNLILQPLVENAIEHGIDQKEDGNGYLLIRASAGENAISFEIRDNGPGMTQEVMDRVLEMKTASYGLRNVNRRLQLFFGEEYALRFQCDQGTCVRLRIPKKTELEHWEP